jgi:D-xylose transport system substrate-binding protein
MRPSARTAIAGGVALALAAGGCTGGSDTRPGPSPSAPASRLAVAFLTPCASTCGDRFARLDVPAFEQAVRSLDGAATVVQSNAQGSAATQVQQAKAALAGGAGVVVVDPVDSAAGAQVAAAARAAGVPVVAYDTLVTGAQIDYFVGFDAGKVGELQAQYLANRVPAGATVAIVNGDQSTPRGRAVKAGAHKILDPLFAAGKLRRGYEADARPATAERARVLAGQALARTGTRLAGVLAATDALAEGVAAALAGRAGAGKVVVTGGGASDAGLRRVLLRTQSMTVYEAVRQEARGAAAIALAAGRGRSAAARAQARTETENGSGMVPTLALTPIVVTSFNLGQTVLADGFTTRQRVCTGPAASKCPT